MAQTNWTEVAARLTRDFAARAAAHDEEDRFVMDNYADLKASRVFSAGVPADLGGGGADLAELCDLLRILGRGCSSTALALSMHMHLVAVPAWRWRTEQAPVDGLLRRVAAEECVLATSGGSDWLASSGKAVKEGDGFRITAQKAFASGVPAASLFLTSAVYDDPVAGPTVLHFALPLQSEGIEVVDTWRTLGMRGTGSNDVVIDGAFVPESQIMARRPAGRWNPLFHLISMIALPLVYSVYVGIAEAAHDLVLERLTEKKKQDADIQSLVGEMENQLRLAQIALQNAVTVGMNARPGPETTSEMMIMRTLIGQAAIRTVERAMGVLGGAGYYRSRALERLFRDVQAARYHPVPEKPQARLTGRVTLGLPIDE